MYDVFLHLFYSLRVVVILNVIVTRIGDELRSVCTITKYYPIKINTESDKACQK